MYTHRESQLKFYVMLIQNQSLNTYYHYSMYFSRKESTFLIDRWQDQDINLGVLKREKILQQLVDCYGWLLSLTLNVPIPDKKKKLI